MPGLQVKALAFHRTFINDPWLLAKSLTFGTLHRGGQVGCGGAKDRGHGSAIVRTKSEFMGELWAAATAFGLLAAWIVWKQTRAKSCPVHQRRAGQLAMVAAALCLGAALVLLALAATANSAMTRQ
jgi:hypothetical protein